MLSTEITKATSTREKYQTLVDFIHTHNYDIEPSQSADFSGAHIVYEPLYKKQLDEILPGVTHPATFIRLRKATEWNLPHEIVDYVFSNDFGTELVDDTDCRAPGSGTPFVAIGRRLASSPVDIESTEAYEQYINVEPLPEARTDYRTRAYVPNKCWFHPIFDILEEQYNFSPADVITIFPPAEREMFEYHIGRTVTGRPDNIQYTNVNPDVTKTYNFKYRTIVIVYGEPGLGKSTQMDYINRTLRILGYDVQATSEFGKQFGVSRYAKANLAYIDDVTLQELEYTFKQGGGTFKSLGSSGVIATEEKYQRETTILSDCAIILNTNNWSSNLAYGVDDGLVSRIRVLTTYTAAEIFELSTSQQLKLEAGMSPIGSESPDLRTEEHITWLCKRLNELVVKLELPPVTITPNLVMAWYFRKCADKFINLTNPQDTFKIISRKLRNQMDLEITSTFIKLMQVAYFLFEPEAKMLPALTRSSLALLLQYTTRLCCDKRLNDVRQHFKQLWLLDGSSQTHPYYALRQLDMPILDIVNKEWQASYTQKASSGQDYIKDVFGNLATRFGFKLARSVESIFRNWNDAQLLYKQHKLLAKELSSILNEFPKTATTGVIESGWLHDEYYNPRSL